MTELLDHAITIRDVLWVWVGAFGLILLAIGAGLLWLRLLNKRRDADHDRLREQIRKDYANAPPFPTRFDRDGQPIYHLRNPAFGVPHGVKWQDGRPYATE
jgi:hypothetical protein